MAAADILVALAFTIWCAMHVPSWVNPLFKQILTSKQVILALLDTAHITFAPGLFTTIASNAPPSLEFLLGLPDAQGNVWSVYIIILMKDGCIPLIYIGSATAVNGSTRARMSEYGRLVVVADSIKMALKLGYKIEHKKSLLTLPTPSVANVPNVRILIVALEAVFTMIFWAVSNPNKYLSYQKFSNWTPDSMSWQGLCSHNPFCEGVHGNFNLSAERLQEMHDAVVAKNKEYQRIYGQNMRANADDEYRERQRNANAKRADVQKDQYKVVKESKAIYCATCEVSFRNQSDLKRHNDTDRHKRYVAHGKDGYKCVPCGFFNRYESNYKVHLKTAGHKQKLAASV